MDYNRYMVQKRWFIGVLLPAELSATITELQRNLVDEQTMLKPLIPHITLIHPNPLIELSPLYFAPIAKLAAQHLLPCKVNLQRVSIFNKNVLHIAVESPELEKIHNKIVSVLPHHIKAQYFVGREFKPHVTLAQARGRNELTKEFVKDFTEKINPILPARFMAEKLTRYEWQGTRTYINKDL